MSFFKLAKNEIHVFWGLLSLQKMKLAGFNCTQIFRLIWSVIPFFPMSFFNFSLLFEMKYSLFFVWFRKSMASGDDEETFSIRVGGETTRFEGMNNFLPTEYMPRNERSPMVLGCHCCGDKTKSRYSFLQDDTGMKWKCKNMNFIFLSLKLVKKLQKAWI